MSKQPSDCAGNHAGQPAYSGQGQATAAGTPRTSGMRSGCGKAILMGEHAVVYGRRAIAAPVPIAVEARVEPNRDGTILAVPAWEREFAVEPLDQAGDETGHDAASFSRPTAVILDALGLAGQNLRIEVHPKLPKAMGLGGSAATAVAIVRALDEYFHLGLDDAAISDLAYQAEKVAHGNASGIDNTVAAYGRPILFRRGSPPEVQNLRLPSAIRLVIGLSGRESLTSVMVERVRQAHRQSRRVYEKLFDEMDQLTQAAREAVESARLKTLGELMNLGHDMLRAIQVSCAELEDLVGIARRHGALGAKLTGAGGGGSMIALCPEGSHSVMRAMAAAGYRSFMVELPPTSD